MSSPSTPICHATPGNAEAGLRILLAEDGADSAESMALLLRMYGHEVKVAGDGLTALETARVYHPDVLLLDIGLPRMDGYEVAKRLRECHCKKRPFIIAVTGFGMEADLRHSAESGIDLHLVKPVDPEQLQALLRRFQGIIDGNGQHFSASTLGDMHADLKASTESNVERN